MNTTTQPPASSKDKTAAIAFAEAHLATCSADIVAWHKTGLLRDDCCLRSLAAMCTWASGGEERAAEDVVIGVLLRRAAAPEAPGAQAALTRAAGRLFMALNTMVEAFGGSPPDRLQAEYDRAAGLINELAHHGVTPALAGAL